MPWVSWGNITGTTGRKLRIEGININLSQDTVHSLTGTIMYRTHVQDIGWTGWKTLGQYSGTSCRAKQVEAIEIKLTGQLATFYNIYYSSHIENYGWLGWASNGQTSGSTGISYRVEALRINLVRKGAPAPGSVANYYKNKPVYTPKPAALDVMSKNAQVRASSTRWLIMTDTSACQVGVYSGSYGNWSRVALWSCGPGKPSTPTVKGEFTIYGRGKSFGSRSYTCWYYTQFYGNYLFHSVLYNRGSMTQIQDGTLGKCGMKVFDKLMELPILRIFNPFYKKYKEMLLYLFFGGLSFIVSIATYACFNVGMGINELIANILSWIITVMFAFLTNRVWVFQSPTDSEQAFIKQMFVFYSGRVITLVVEEAILLVFITWLGFNSMLIKVIAQVIVIVLNYVISKLVVFKERS